MAQDELNRAIDKIRYFMTQPSAHRICILYGAPQCEKNIVASADLGVELNLDAIVFGLPNCEYEPEQFPGLIYRLKKPKVVLLLFGSGKIVCTGAKTREDVENAIVEVRRALRKIGVKM